ncbi:MAG: TonB-dependent receptor [Novosphingobium sp.]|uniref:TonB-dependent receptor domain-containing protein n=1 Tax=Novosphingobium sp. TaxID=1874826 RepID=UPI002732641A|nr:TonB-dependent receptor [Novosphingobium sp.]MDP3550197.1 TonB-dependent receptor [Novosphingobium sp.]
MIQSSMLKRAALKRSTAIAAVTLALVSPVAFAQEAQAEGEEPAQAIVVTGSRIARSDVTSVAPVSIVGAEEFRLTGTVNAEQVLNALPQVIPGTTSFSNNPGGGVATLDLRGLGAQRTMVLVNGRRYMFYGTDQTVDLNTIPTFLLKNVEVVTGGGSAVYGSDALAGVVNFQLRDNLQGLEVGVQQSLTGQGDGRRFNANIAMGTEFADNRGNVTVYGEYNKRGSVFASARDFSRTALGDGATSLVPLGSAGVPQGRLVATPSLAIGIGSSCTAGSEVNCFPIAAGTNYPGLGAFFSTPGTSRPYAGSDSYNFAPVNYLMVPQERWLLGGYGDYEINANAKAYFEFSYVNNRVENELAATPITQNVDFQLSRIQGLVSASDFAQLTQIAANQQIAIAAAATPGCAAVTATNPTGVCTNPFGAFRAGTSDFGALQPGSARIQVNTRTTGISSRNASDDRSAFRALGGLRGDITDSIRYDAYYMYSRTRNSQIQEGNVSRSAFTRLAGNGTCNVFGFEQLSDSCLNSIAILAQNTVISELQVAQASITGDLFKLGTSNEPIRFAVGTEWRQMGSEFIPDTALSSGDVVGFNAGQPTEGSYTATEFFGELSVPLIQDGFIHRLEIDGAVRYSDYSLEAVGGVWAYSAGVRFAPVRDITFRGQYQRAIRAPNVGELFGGQSVGFPAATDPCSLASSASNATIRDLCIATGVPGSSVGTGLALQPNAQIQGAFGGNPNLSEEVSDTWTAGVVIQPSFVRGLTLQVDFYDISIDKSISTAGGGVNNILNLCYNVIQNANSAICGLISRDSQGIISGPPFVVSANNANLASLETRGVDFQLDYATRMGFGMFGEESRLAFNFLATYTDKYTFTPLVDLPEDNVQCAGKFGLNCGDPIPKFKANSRLSWIDGPLTTSVRWRHVGATDDDDDATDFIVDRIGAYNVFDLSLSAEVTEGATINMGVNNLFNKAPPVIGSNAQQANTYPSTFDVLGRDFFISAQFRF